jgi:hypothetical protein
MDLVGCSAANTAAKWQRRVKSRRGYTKGERRKEKLRKKFMLRIGPFASSGQPEITTAAQGWTAFVSDRPRRRRWAQWKFD